MENPLCNYNDHRVINQIWGQHSKTLIKLITNYVFFFKTFLKKSLKKIKIMEFADFDLNLRE